MPLLAGLEGPSSRVLNGQGMVLNDLAGAVVAINSPQGTTLLFKGVQDSPCEESLNGGMPVIGGDMLERLPTISEGVPEINASLVFGEINRLYEQVIFADPTDCSTLVASTFVFLTCLFFLWLQAKALYNQTFTQYQVEVTRLKHEKALLPEQVI